jgi:hypothetical protein
MRNSWHRLLTAGLVVLLVPGLAQAWRFGFFRPWGYYRSAYYPAYYGGAYYPNYSYPTAAYVPYSAYPAGCAVMPAALATTTPYAVPKAAPPSQTPEPPTASSPKKPTITESRSLGGSYPAASSEIGSLPVGFWNATGRDVSLTVNGQTHSLRRNQALNLRLDRTFTWQLAGGEARQENVPDSQLSHEVILRP